MTPTEQLKEEHGGVKVMLGILGKICDRMESGKPVPVQHLEQILEFLMVFVDICHHGKEEEHLFPALKASGVPVEGGSIGRMLRSTSRDAPSSVGWARPRGRMRKGP